MSRQHLADEMVNIRARTADEKNSSSRFNTRINFRRHHIADERIAQRDQMHICRKKKSWKILQRDEPRAIKGRATRTELLFDLIRLCPRCIKPKLKAVPRSLSI